jgi:hypothetical protein
MISIYLLLLLFIFFIFTDNKKGITVLIIISLLNNLLNASFGFKIPFHLFISLILFPYVLYNINAIPSKYKNLVNPILIEFVYLILLAIIFGFIIPWEYNEFDRTWTQRALGRSFIQILRMLSEFSLLFLILLWLNKNKITVKFLLNTTSIIIITSVIFAIIDTLFFHGILKVALLSTARDDLGNRFVGLNAEPREFGQVCSFVSLLLVCFAKFHKNKLTRYGIILSFIGVLISFSASTYLLTIVWLFIYLLITKKYKKIAYVSVFIILSYFSLIQIDFFKDNTLSKIEFVLNSDIESIDKEKVKTDEPDIFTKFEIFDRAALNFLHSEPLYLIIGTGPNLISIPASKYLNSAARSIYGDTINSVPHSFLVNLISRSGVLGFCLWLYFFILLLYQNKNMSKEFKSLIYCLFLSNFIVATPLFFFIIAIIAYVSNNINIT